LFIDVVPGSASFAKAVGEIGLGIGHHKNAFSPAQPRISISNIADCDNVVQVIDYADPALPKLVKKWSAAELDPARMCSPMMGVTPHGAAAAHNGHGFHNLTGWGTMLSVDQDAEMPSFKLLPTAGTGAGYTKLGDDGLYIYSLQRTPREADAAKPGVPCQIGQLVVVDAHGDAVAGQVPILLTGPTCTAALPAYAATASPDHIKISKDGKTMFITTQTGAAPMGMPETYSDQLVVFDLTDGAHPVQKPSVTVGKHTGHRAMAVTGDGKWLFVVNNSDKTVSQVDVNTLSVTRTITLKAAPAQLASWGSAEGPSSQTGPQ
jgi:YVTN family beta-propeller protein